MAPLAAAPTAASRRRARELHAQPTSKLCANTAGYEGQPLLVAGHPLAAPALLESLSTAERAVAAAALRGCSHAEIARERGSSPRTVANQLAGAFRKLEVRSRAELAAKLVTRNRTLRRALPTGPSSDADDGRSFAVASGNQMSDSSARLASLSERERQAATLAALGHGNKHIAHDLGIAPSTVSKYLERAATKLGAGSRVSLIQIMCSLPIETDEASSGEK
jgi:DNA-binding NarL/FixJ family response regulator